MTRERPASETGAPSAATVATLDKAERALALRLEGAPLSTIAHELELTAAEARALMREAVERWRSDVLEETDSLVAMTQARYERLWQASLPLAIEGDDKHAKICLAVLAAQRELFGLDAKGDQGSGDLGDEIAAFVSESLDVVDAEWEEPERG